jgi:predicted nucleic acid-binding protein
MATTKVLDSWALIAFFEDEPAANAVEEILHRAALDRHELLMSVINWGEVYYNTMRKTSQTEAEARIQEIASLPIEVVGIGDDLEMTRRAAIYKATYSISYADAFAAALVKERKAEFITGDPDFKRLEKEIKITWLK